MNGTSVIARHTKLKKGQRRHSPKQSPELKGIFLRRFVVTARGGFVGDLPCEEAIASAQPIKILLSFIVIAAASRNDGAFDCGSRFALVPPRTISD